MFVKGILKCYQNEHSFELSELMAAPSSECIVTFQQSGDIGIRFFDGRAIARSP